MIPEITGAISSAKAALDLTKALLDLNKAADSQLKVIELQKRILDIQEQLQCAWTEINTRDESIRQLKNELEKRDDQQKWERTYVLKDYGAQTFAFEYIGNESPSHKACPTCFNLKRRSILHFLHTSARKQDIYACDACGQKVPLGTPIEPEPTHRQRPGSGWLHREL